MRGFVILLIVIVIIAVFGFLAVNISNEKPVDNEAKVFEFSTFTSAVCENKEEFVYCKDEVFVNCNGKISKMAETKECNGFKLDFPDAVGFAVFEKDWNKRG